MPNYQESRIYRLEGEGKYYIGSTTKRLCERKAVHKAHAKRYPDRKIYNYFNTIGWDKVNIILIETFPCNNKEELNAKEDEHIKKYITDSNCLNSRGALMTSEQRNDYAQKYKESDIGKTNIKEAKIKWENSDKCKAYKSEKILCDCGLEVQRSSLYHHRTSSRHEQHILKK